MTPELVIFDFDGTLGHRPGMWTGCLHDVLTQHVPGHKATVEDLRAHLQDGFPWHRPDVPHPHLSEPDDWWEAFGVLIDRVYVAVGVDPRELVRLRGAVRRHYCDPTRFELYADTVPALTTLRSAGVRAVILSNHVPELGAIASHLGLDDLVDDVFTSALIGFEKPHPEAYLAALGPTRPDRAWMIGDNPVADRDGAAQVGIQPALVRHPEAGYQTVLEAVADALSGLRPRDSWSA